MKSTPTEFLDQSFAESLKTFPTLEAWLKSDASKVSPSHKARVKSVYKKYGHLSAVDLYMILRNDPGLLPTTKNQIIGIMKKFKPELRGIPSFKDTRKNENKPTWTIDELSTMVNSKYARAIPYVMLIYTGCRIGELYHLRCFNGYQEATLTEDSIVLNAVHQESRGEMKTGERHILPQPELYWFLRRRCHMGSGKLPARPFKHTIYQNTFESDMKSLGINIGNRTLHSFRHTYAAIMLASGCDPMMLQLSLGHSSPAQTQHYAKSAVAFSSYVKNWEPGRITLLHPLPGRKGKNW